MGEVISSRFRILSVAGHGGMGTVYRAVDLVDGTTVALKLMHHFDASSLARFGHEAKVLAEIKHPHVVQFVAHGLTAGGEPYLVMEWLEGETLADRLARGRLSVAESLHVTRLIANALGTAHAKGIVHRDIKPNNLFLVHGELGNVKVLDFGIAYRVHARTVLTATGTVLGTPGYMSPEQARGESLQIDGRADVFSLGCVLFECLAGKPAFQGAHALALLAKLLLADPPHIRDLVPAVPADLDAYLWRMLAKNPDERPAEGLIVDTELAAFEGRTESRVSLPPAANETITAIEARVISLVVMTPGATDVSSAPDSTLLAASALHAQLPNLRRAAEPFRAKVEEIAGGSIVAVVSGVGNVSDQAALAARCALRFRALTPNADMVLVTGRSDDAGRLLLNERIDQAAWLLMQQPTTPSASQEKAAILLDQQTRALLDARFDIVERSGTSSLENERIMGDDARLLLGRVSPFVGRERELRTLVEFVESSIDESRSSVILVTANAGIGKSRLRHEFLRKLRQTSPQVGIAIGRGDSIAAGSAYGMLAGAIRNRFGIMAGEPLVRQQEKLAVVVDDLIAESEQQRVKEFLGEMLGIHFPDESSPMLKAARQSPALMALQIQSAYIDFASRVVQRRPALLVLEDVHWGDAPSVAVVGSALKVLREKPFLVVAFARPEVHDEFPRLWSDCDFQEIRLRELPKRAAEQLVRAMLTADVDTKKVDAIVKHADGNAFYLEELIRSVVEGHGEAWPETVLGMVESRLNALEPNARRLLRAASIFGEVFWRRGIPKLIGEGFDSDGRDTLTELVVNEVLVKRPDSRLAGEEEFAFRHALLREGAYATLTERDRMVGHRLVGEWLEEAGETDQMRLAEHFSLGGVGERAATYYLRAGELALEGSDFAAAKRLSEKGIALTREHERLAALWAVVSDAAYGAGDLEGGLSASEHALALARHGSRNHCRGLSSLMGAALFLRRADIGKRVIERLLPTDPDDNAIAPLAGCFSNAILSLVMGSRRADTERYMNRLEQIAARTSQRDDLAWAWIEQSRATWKFSVERNPWAAVLHIRAALEHSERAGDRSQIARTEVSIGWYVSRLGLFDDAIPYFSSSAAKTSPTSPVAMIRMGYHCCMEVDRGAFAEAKKMADEIIRIADLTGDKFISVSARLNRIEMRIAEGDLDGIDEEAFALAANPGMTPNRQLWYWAVLAQLRLAQGRQTEALEFIVQSRELSRSLCMESFRHAYVSLVYAETLLASSDERAVAAIREAHDDLMSHANLIADERVRRSFLENFETHRRIIALAKQWVDHG